MDYQTIVVALIIGAAVLYTGTKLWDMVKPGPKAGCGCSGTDAKTGCSGCPLVKP